MNYQNINVVIRMKTFVFLCPKGNFSNNFRYAFFLSSPKRILIKLQWMELLRDVTFLYRICLLLRHKHCLLNLQFIFDNFCCPVQSSEKGIKRSDCVLFKKRSHFSLTSIADGTRKFSLIQFVFLLFSNAERC